MAPVKKYEHKKKGNTSRFGILGGTITKPVPKRKTCKKLAVLKPVISPIIHTLLQSANSLDMQTEDTFDKLMASYLEKKEKKNCSVTRSMTRSFLNVTSESNENLTLPSVFMPKNLLSSTPLEVKKIDVKDSSSPITRRVMMKTKSPNASNLSIRRSERIARRQNSTISGDWYGSSWSEPHLEITDSSSSLNGGKFKLSETSEQIENSIESLNKVDHNLKELAVNITQYNFNNDHRLNVLKKREQTNNVQNKNKAELDSVIIIEDSSSSLNGGKSKLAKTSEQIENSTESLNKVDHNLKELAVNITQYNFNNDQRLNVLKKRELTESNNVQNKNNAELDSVITIDDSQISNSCNVRYPLMSIENRQSLDKRKSYELTPKPQVSKKLQNNHNEELVHQGLDSIQNLNPLEQRRSDRETFVAKENSSGRNRSHSEDNPLFLKPGKEWKRSFLMSKRMSINISCQNFDFGKSSDCVTLKGIVCPCVQCRRRTIVGESILPRRVSVRAVPFSPVVERNLTFLENYAESINSSYASNSGEQKNGSVFDGYRRLGDDEEEDGFEPPRPDRDKEVEGGFRPVTARDVVLSKCKQSEPLPFEKCYPNSILQHCQKIGEGVFGEVFLFRNPNGGGVTVIKVIPIEGSRTVNGERQKTFEEILSEITIQMELTGLRDGTDNRAGSFSQLLRVTCVRGRYPDRLVELWELFEETHGTENDSPEAFDDDQLYVVFELANGGKDMENYTFSNAKQAFALFKQLACALAVAEVSLEFEHRDLHLGNVLVSVARPRSFVTFCLDGKEIEVPTYGVQLTIIDYTLSRIKHNGVCMYNDLATDPDLFTAEGDYQFEVYRLMRTTNEITSRSNSAFNSTSPK